MSRNRWLIVSSLLVGSFGILAGIVQSQTKLPGSSSSSFIVAEDCHVRLVDTAILASSRTGILDFVEPEEFDRVLMGQVIAKLDDRVPQATLKTAEHEAKSQVEILYARKLTEVAEAEYLKGVLANKEVPETYTEIELRRLKLAAERGGLQIEQAKNNKIVAGLKRDETQEILKTFEIQAPFDGLVTAVHKHKGEAVREGDPILEIVSLKRVRVEGSIPLAHAWRVKPGDRVKVQVNDIEDADLKVEETEFEGRIRSVDIRTDSQNQLVLVRADVDNQEELLLEGLSVRMVIEPSTASTLTKARRTNR